MAGPAVCAQWDRCARRGRCAGPALCARGAGVHGGTGADVPVLPRVPKGQVCQLLEVAISTVGAMLLLAPSEKMDRLWLRHGQCCSLETKPAPALEASGQLTTESGVSAPNRPSRTQQPVLRLVTEATGVLWPRRRLLIQVALLTEQVLGVGSSE